MERQYLTGAIVSHTLYGIIAGGLCIGDIEPIQAAEKKTYTRPPFTVFSSQMPDALLGSDKYEKPVWNLHDTLGLPDWLSVSLEQRTRYETQEGTFRANTRGGDQQIALQTDLWLEAHLGSFRAGTEFLDARALATDSGSVSNGLNNTHANPADFIQGYLAWAEQNLFFSGIGAEVMAGRQTLNFGSRRLVARNAFRNTINTFTGGRLRLTDYSHWQFNGFVTMPVIRYPTAAADILNDVIQFDKEDTHTLFSGGFLELYNLGWDINSEVYLYHLDESDSTRNLTRNRRYFTPGVRVFIKPAKAKFDFQGEIMGQLGTVRATTAANDSRNLNHAAWSHHLDVGYTFDMPWSPRFALEYDYASGNKNPNDGTDQRFDLLFGARRFDFGPTGMYGAFYRSNINTPGVRINVAPRADVQFILAHRAFWLASASDCWGGSTCTGTSLILRPKAGGSGDYVGQQLELSARWDLNGSLNLETGWAHLFKGQFAKNAQSAPAGIDVDYVYVQSMLRF
ncbi:MAG: alginate export family protein [Methylobacter sp.]|nr:alginate export family protein [Methylobacter sp.]